MGPPKGPIPFFRRGPSQGRGVIALGYENQGFIFCFLPRCRRPQKLRLEIAEGCRVADLQRELVAAYPQLAAVQRVLSIAVNAEYAGSHTVLKAGDEVALIPPVSGVDVFKIPKTQLNPALCLPTWCAMKMAQWPRLPGCAQSLWDQQTDYLVYEAYPLWPRRRWRRLRRAKGTVGRCRCRDDSPRGQARNRRNQRVDCRC